MLELVGVELVGLWASNGAVVAPGPLASEDAVVGLRDTYGVCGIRVRAEAMRKWCYGQEC